MTDGIRNKSEQVKERVMENIVKNVFRTGERIPSEQKLMREFGVSRVTVRKAITDLARRGVVSRTRGRGGTLVTEDALRIIERETARARKSLLTVGIVLHPRMMRDSVIEKYFRLLIQEMKNEVSFKVFFHDYLNPEEYLNSGCKLLIVDWGFPGEEVAACGKKIDLVVFARDRGGNFIVDDNVGAGEMAVRYLAEMGHRKVVCFPLEFHESVTHFKGENQAATELGVNLLPVRVSSMHSDDINVRMSKLLSADSDFTAIIAPTDRDAIKICEILKNAGRRVPEDISIISYDDMFFSEYYETPLTTVSHPYDRIALTFAEAIRHFIQTGELSVQAVIPCSVTERESVKRL